MGLDGVELVLRCEEVFNLHIEDHEASQIVTVGQLFERICTRLDLPAGTRAPEHPGKNCLRPRLSITPQLDPWSREDLWATLVAVFCDQLGLDAEEVTYNARIGEDLGVD